MQTATDRSVTIKVYATGEVRKNNLDRLRTSIEVLTTILLPKRSRGNSWVKEPQSYVISLEADSKHARHEVSQDGYLTYETTRSQSVYVTIAHGAFDPPAEKLEALAFGTVALLIATLPGDALHQPECRVKSRSHADVLWWSNDATSDASQNEAATITRIVQAVIDKARTIPDAQEEILEIWTARRDTGKSPLRAVG